MSVWKLGSWAARGLFLGLLISSLFALAESSGAAPQTAPACPERDVMLNQAGVGQVSADQLDTDGDAVVLSGACFIERGLQFDSVRLRVLNGVVDSGALKIAGQGLTGEARSGHAEGKTFTLSGLNLTVALPDTELGQLPLPQGHYSLQADSATLVGDGAGGDTAPSLGALSPAALSLGSAVLTQQDGARQVYKLEGALLRGGQLTARSAQLGRVEAQGVQASAQQLSATSSVIGLCSDPADTQLQLRTGPLTVRPGEALATDARFEVFGSVLYSVARLSLPLAESGDDLAGSLNQLGDVGRLLPSLPTAVLGADGYGLRGLQFPDAHHTQLDLVAHANFMEAGVQTQFGDNTVRFGVFHDPSVTDPNPPVPLAEAALFKDTPGVIYRLALRTPDRLSDARLGYAGSFGALGYRTDVGVGRQNGVNAAFVHGNLRLQGQEALGAFGVSGLAELDDYVFGVGNQLVFTGQAQLSWAADGFGASLTQDERSSWGVDPLPDLVLSTYRLTTLNLNYTAPDAGAPGFHFAGASYLLQYDWLAREFSANVATLSASEAQPGYAILPRVSYDFADQRVGVGSDLLLKNACFDYGVAVDASVQPGVPGSFRVGLGLRFNLH